MTAIRTTPKRASKLPRAGTRVEAVIKAWQKNPTASHWSDLKAAYDNKAPALSRGSRTYTGMELSRITKRYGKRVSRGVYRLDERWWSHRSQYVPTSKVDALVGYRVGDKVEVVEPNAEMESIGLTRGTEVRVCWIEGPDSADPAYDPDRLLVKVDFDTPNNSTGFYFASRFRKVSTYTCTCGYAGALEGKSDGLEGRGVWHTWNNCSPIRGPFTRPEAPAEPTPAVFTQEFDINKANIKIHQLNAANENLKARISELESKQSADRYPAYLDELEDLARGLLALLLPEDRDSLRNHLLGVEQAHIGAEQILEVISAAKKGNW